MYKPRYTTRKYLVDHAAMLIDQVRDEQAISTARIQHALAASCDQRADFAEYLDTIREGSHADKMLIADVRKAVEQRRRYRH